MKKFDYKKHLEQLNSNNLKEMVTFYAKSNLPNTWFLQQFSGKKIYPFYKKHYWPFFAMVLIERGIESFTNEGVLVMIWFQDFNWPGLREIVVFMRENAAFFKSYFVEAMVEAFQTDDIGWIMMLLGGLLVDEAQDSKMVNNIMEYARKNMTTVTDKKVKTFKEMSEKIYDKHRYPDHYSEPDTRILLSFYKRMLGE